MTVPSIALIVNRTSQQITDATKNKKRLTIAQKRLAELETLPCKIYEDHLLGKLPEARYTVLDAKYSKEQRALVEEITCIERQLASMEQKIS